MGDIERLKTRLDSYYALEESIKDAQVKIEEIQYEMVGVKGISFDTIQGLPESREHKLIRLQDKKDYLESIIDHTMLEMAFQRPLLHFERLNETEMKMIEMRHRDKRKLEVIADEVGYSDKSALYRAMLKVYERML